MKHWKPCTEPEGACGIQGPHAHTQPWHTLALRWVRLEDEHGRLSLTTVSVLIGMGLLFAGWVLPFVASLCLYAVKKLIQHAQTQTAMEGAQEAGLRQMDLRAGEDVAALAKEIAAVKAKVNEIDVPRRDDALRRVTGGK